MRYPEESQKPVGSNPTGFCTIAMRDLRLAGRWINYGSDFQDAVSGESAAPCVLPDHVLVGGDVCAIDAICRDIAMYPLDTRSHFIQHAARLLRDALQVCG